MNRPTQVSKLFCMTTVLLIAAGCVADEPKGLAKSGGARVTVKMDFNARPLPEVPLPNDIATIYDETSATKRRVNASMIAPTRLERRVREKVDQLDGWGVNQPITIPFTDRVDVGSILDGHRDADYDLANDVIYLIDIDPNSPEYGQKKRLDVGNGNYPFVLEDTTVYGPHDARGDTLTLLFEEVDEDTNGNGTLDPGEDTDMDGVLDKPNYLPGAAPNREDLAARTDALMTFYENETNTLIVRPMMPLRERTTYAVVVTRRLLDTDGDPVGSPFKYINHTAQNEPLKHLPQTLAPELTLSDVAFTWTFTTQTVQSGWVAVREGLYGYGVQGHLGKEYPPEFNLEQLRDISYFEGDKNPYVLYTENWLNVFKTFGPSLFSFDESDGLFKRLSEAQQYIDYHVMGSFDSPQLFERDYGSREAPSCEVLCEHLSECATRREIDAISADCRSRCADWNPAQRACRADRCQAFEVCEDELPKLHYDEQSWPEDLHSKPAQARREKVYFWLAVPRKEVSPRKEGKPAPVVIVSHGYTLNRVDTMIPFAGELARRGNAVIAIDCVSHGPKPLDEMTQMLATALLQQYGLAPLIDILLETRAEDLNRDGIIDSGADFWTSYLFHTRDVVRQCNLDHMQLIRILRNFDGVNTAVDLNGDEQPELAGDFDGDGVVDIGGPDGKIGMIGTSLGGIMSATLAGTEPGLDAAVPVAGGGILTDIGARSFQGGVVEAVVLRLMSSIFIGERDDETGMTRVQTLVPNLNDRSLLELGSWIELMPGQIVLATNIDNGERECARVDDGGHFRLHLPTDLDDRVTLAVFDQEITCLCDSECEPGQDAAEPIATFDRLGQDVDFQGHTFASGTHLRAFAEGLGLRRAAPELRRFMGLGQLVLDPADPAALAPHFTDRPMVFPNVGDETSTHTIVVTTMGDMNVPASSGVSVSRAAGYVDFMNPDPRYDGTEFAGLTPNQILIDTYVAEAVHTLDRFQDASGAPVHYDVENFSAGEDIYQADAIPRLDPPLRLKLDEVDPTGGVSGAMFLFVHPTGWHGFALPGTERVQALDKCQDVCEDDDDACAADCVVTANEVFDGGDFMSGMIANYFATGGREFRTDPCLGRDNCEGDKPPLPAERESPEAEKAE